MAYWLLKSEPGSWSWEKQVGRGDEGEPWNGVRNYQANNNMKAMKLGDRAFFYHSVDEKRIVGVVEVIGLWRPDPSDASGKFGMVQVKALAPLKTPVTLEQVKADPALAEMVLAKNSRLSVQPVDPASWKRICKLGGVKA
jgi:predicted RNA-binding protein with PUA-like domain